CHVGHGLGHLADHLPAELRVRHLPPLEAHRDLGLVALLEEAAHVLQLELEVVPLGLRAHLHFLDHDHGLLLARLLLPPRLHVLELPEVHDAADGRGGFGSDIHEVRLALARRPERMLDWTQHDLMAHDTCHTVLTRPATLTYAA